MKFIKFQEKLKRNVNSHRIYKKTLVLEAFVMENLRRTDHNPPSPVGMVGFNIDSRNQPNVKLFAIAT
jgi:hypothetical protein